MGAAGGDQDVTIIRKDVVGGVEAEPAFAGNMDFTPSMGGLGAAQVGFRAVVEITADVTGGNAE